MRISQAWIVATKDFATFRKKRNILFMIFMFPFLISFLLPGVLWYIQNRGKGPVSPAELVVLMPAFAFFYLIIAGVTPTYIASYSLVGEKVEKSLEPLLATPTSDSEVLFGKGIAAIIPPMAAVLAGSAIYMGLTDAVTVGALGYYYFPNWNTALVLFLMVPLAIVLSVEWNVLVSSRVSDVRIAQQLGALAVIPYAGVYVSGELNLVPLGDTNTLLIITAIIALFDFILLYLVQATFQREEILTRWK